MAVDDLTPSEPWREAFEAWKESDQAWGSMDLVRDAFKGGFEAALKGAKRDQLLALVRDFVDYYAKRGADRLGNGKAFQFWDKVRTLTEGRS